MKKYLLATILVLLGIVGGLYLANQKQAVLGSTVVGNDYFGTSTRSVTGTNNIANLTVLKAVGGSVARVTISGANTGIIRLWNATTTNVNLRVGATSTLTVIEIPASAAANVYDYDVDFPIGILYELVSGSAPTSTIVWR